MALWRAALPDELVVVPGLGSSLDGAVLLAQRTDLPHEPRVLRLAAKPARAAGCDGAPGPVDVDTLETEQVQADLLDLDLRSPTGLVDALLDAEATVPAAVRAARDEIVQAVSLIERAFGSGGRLVYVGAGTPGRLAALDAAECPPTFGTPPDQVVAVLAGGDEAAAAAVEGAEDDAEAGRHDILRADVGARDVVVGISASGRTPYVLAALAAARDFGAATVAVVNNTDSEAWAVADVTIELRTGAEVLAGSTRLKAGTSQKVVLNTLSTAAMVRSGKSFGAWMVDVQTSNEKLRRRARRIVREATGADDETALRALRLADWHTKTALVAILADVEASRAAELLDGTGGRVRDAIAAGTRAGSAEEASG
jgi:N-acetylmuramic acid 6-phosphate etherase